MSATALGGGPAGLETARAAMSLYPIAVGSRVELVRYGENTTYRVSDGERSLALRLARPGYQSPASAESEIAWMSALRERGLATPRPVEGRDGKIVQQVRLDGGRVQLAVAFEWVEGVPLADVEGLQPWRRLGGIMAQVHEHARSWCPPHGFTRPAWDLDALVGDSPRWGTPVPRGVWGETDRRLILEARTAVRERLERFGTGPARFGLIHADLAFENVLVQPDGNAVVIDFDDSGPSWYLYELATTLFPLEGTSSFRARRDLLTAGYRDVGRLSEDDLAELPTFLMCRRLATLGWTFSRADTPHAQRQRERRLATGPGAARRFLEWHGAHS
jgi:Ser/Thr protein kinase RdoA (MazF antagonist)